MNKVHWAMECFWGPVFALSLAKFIEFKEFCLFISRASLPPAHAVAKFHVHKLCIEIALRDGRPEEGRAHYYQF